MPLSKSIRSLAILITITILTLTAAHAQTGTWVWQGGSSTVNALGIYGSTPETTNIPGARVYSISWTDNNGNFWLFGGVGNNSSGYGYLNDLWEYSPTNGTWAWVSGSNQLNQPTGATPGGRYDSAGWVDNNGNLWLYGGFGYGGSGEGYLNDLWMYNIAANTWSLMGGSVNENQSASYATQGTPSASNNPGSRYLASSWTDGNGNLWLYGGYGVSTYIYYEWIWYWCGFDTCGYWQAETGYNYYYDSDLWMYNPTINEWTWANTYQYSTAPNFGSLGDPAPSNEPGSRYASMNWPDTNGNLWLFGGYNYSMGYLNDLWSYNTTSQDWTWVSGNDTANQGGTYGPLGQFSTSYDPGARQSSVTWTDNQGNLWLLGGYGYVPGNEGYLNDLWSFNPTNDQWALMSGSSSVNQSGVYGALYSPSATNIPGARQSSISWKDENGNLWLFGGYGIDSTGNYGYLNDLWEFQPTIATTTLLTSSSNPSTYGVSVTFTATVSPTTGSTTPTGSVQFSVNGSPVGSAVTLVSGQATYTTSTLAVGTQAISAVYTPTGVYTGSTSNTVNQQVNDISTTSVLVSSLNPSPVGVSVTFTSTVSPTTGSSTPTGTVTFTSNGSPICSSVTLSGGQATCSTSTLTVGLDNVIAAYTATGNYTGSISNQISQQVQNYAATPLITPGSQTFYVPVTVTIADTTPGAVIHYTTDGSTPITSPTTQTYSGPFSISATTTVNAIATASGYANSSQASATYTLGNFFWGPTTTSFTYGTSLGSVPGLLSASASVPGTWAYSIHGTPVSGATVLNVGQYQLDAIFTSPTNVQLDKISYKLTVVPATLVVTPLSVVVTYGSPVPHYNYSITGYVNSDTSAVVTGTPTINANATSRATTTGAVVYTSNTGNYTINSTWGSLKAANYTFSFQSALLAINPCTCSLTVIPYDAVITQGSPIPSSFNYKVTGFLNWDNAANQLTGTAATSTNAVNGSPHGYYTIYSAPGTLAQLYNNYSGINYSTATLTIH